MCCENQLTGFYVRATLTLNGLSIYPLAQSNLNLEIKGKLNFNDFLLLTIFEIFQLCTKHAGLERTPFSVTLFETFTSNQPFICRHRQTIKQ